MVTGWCMGSLSLFAPSSRGRPADLCTGPSTQLRLCTAFIARSQLQSTATPRLDAPEADLLLDPTPNQWRLSLSLGNLLSEPFGPNVRRPGFQPWP